MFNNNLIDKKITKEEILIIDSTVKYVWGVISNETFSKTNI